MFYASLLDKLRIQISKMQGESLKRSVKGLALCLNGCLSIIKEVRDAG
jgi:hypothetical protein